MKEVGEGECRYDVFPFILSVIIPDSLIEWTVSPHSTDNEMDSWKALPTRLLKPEPWLT